MKHRILFLFLLSTIPITLKAQFEHCQSSTDRSLWDVYFLDDQTGVAVGDSGTIIRSTDGGFNWNTVLTADSVHFKKVAFFDEFRGLAVGTHLFKTVDGGMTWSPVPLKNEAFYDIETFESGKCLVSGFPVALVRSEDFGMTWDTLIRERPDDALGLIDFIDEDTGYACIMGSQITDQILKTTDGGEQWNTIQTLTGHDISIIETLEFYSESIGFRGGWYNPHFMKTDNGAEDWSRVEIDSSALQFQMYDLHIGDDQNATFWGCGWHGLVFRSDDFGEHWQSLVPLVPTEVSLYGIYFLNDDLGWIVGQGGTVLRTGNGGGTVAVERPKSETKLRIYPNPTRGKIHINHPGNEITKVCIINRRGQKLREYRAQSNLDLSTLPMGMYFIEIVTDQGRYVQRMFIDQ